MPKFSSCSFAATRLEPLLAGIGLLDGIHLKESANKLQAAHRSEVQIDIQVV